MKVIILAGGLGSRLSEETDIRPKPMVEVGGRPVLWHLMKIYSHFGYNNFVIALGYKGEVIKRFFMDYRLLTSSVSISLASGDTNWMAGEPENWLVQMIDTGATTETGGRVRRLRSSTGDQTFMMTYGDGVADINISKLVAFHRSHGKLATVTAVRPPSRFGAISLDGNKVVDFEEKPQVNEGWINGGFFVLEPGVYDYIRGDDITFEKEPLRDLSRDGQLMAYRHSTFWQPMDTLRELRLLRTLWEQNKAPWLLWQ